MAINFTEIKNKCEEVLQEKISRQTFQNWKSKIIDSKDDENLIKALLVLYAEKRKQGLLPTRAELLKEIVSSAAIVPSNNDILEVKDAPDLTEMLTQSLPSPAEDRVSFTNDLVRSFSQLDRAYQSSILELIKAESETNRLQFLNTLLVNLKRQKTEMDKLQNDTVTLLGNLYGMKISETSGQLHKLEKVKQSQQEELKKNLESFWD